MVCWGWQYHFKYFKGCLPQILLVPILNTFPQMFTVGAFKGAVFINLQVFSGVIYLRNFIAVPFIGVEELFSLYINVTLMLHKLSLWYIIAFLDGCPSLYFYYLYLQLAQRSKITNKSQLPSKSNMRVSR